MSSTNSSNSTYTCPETITSWYANSLITFGSIFVVVSALSIFTTWRYIKQNPGIPRSGLYSKYLLTFSLFVKAALSLTLGISFENRSSRPSLTTFLFTFPGYVINVSYMAIFISWCNSLSFILSYESVKSLKNAKKAAIGLIAVSLVQYTISTFAPMTQLYGKSVHTLLLSLFSIMWDSAEIVMFIWMAIKVRKSSAIECGCHFGSPEQTIFQMSVMFASAICVRIISYLKFFFVQKSTSTSVNCSSEYLAFFILKEVVGQLLPLSLVVLSDLLPSMVNVDEYPAGKRSTLEEAL